MSLTIISAFGPGRPHLFGAWTRTITNLGMPLHDLRLVVLVNGDPALYDHLALWFSDAVPDGELLYLDHHPDRRRSSSRRVAHHIADVYNRMCDRAQPDAHDWILSIEPDVSPLPGDYDRLASLVQPDVGIVGAAIRSRQKDHVMAYHCRSVEPWRLDRKRLPRGPGVVEVDAVSMGFTLIRAELLRGFRFTGNPNRDGSGGNGHEWSLMKRARRDGWRVLCQFDLSPIHRKH